ncbi:hypothetical protein [Mycolicibacterium goodii]|nr:hypothetical protein [Mycolicibacterium goodii]
MTSDDVRCLLRAPPPDEPPGLLHAVVWPAEDDGSIPPSGEQIP